MDYKNHAYLIFFGFVCSKSCLISNVEIVDITGRLVFNHANNGFSTIRIDTSNFVNGLYLVRIHTVEGLTYTDKLVK